VIGGGVLDASALLAVVFEESGARRVETVLHTGALMSAVNWAETLSRMVERGVVVDDAVPALRAQVEALGTLRVVPFDEAQGREVARLRPLTRSLGLSLGDRACLALGRLHGLPVLTTDRDWRSLRLSIRIEVIR